LFIHLLIDLLIDLFTLINLKQAKNVDIIVKDSTNIKKRGEEDEWDEKGTEVGETGRNDLQRSNSKKETKTEEVSSRKPVWENGLRSLGNEKAKIRREGNE